MTPGAMPDASQALYRPPAPPEPVFGPQTKEEAARGMPVFVESVPKESTSMRMFGTEDPTKQYFDRTPASRFSQGVARLKGKASDVIQQYVDQYPEDADLARSAPLSSWAKDIGMGLAQIPFRAARFVAKGIDTLDPAQMIPDRLLKIPKVEDSVLRVAAAVGIPLEEAQQTAKEKPSLLQSLHDGFVVPAKDGFQIATMPNGPEKEQAFDAWAYKTSQSFVSGLTIGVLDDAMQKNSLWLENGELKWRGVTITQLTEMENKGVSAGQLTGQLAGSLVTYAVVSPMLTAELRSFPVLNRVYESHPYLASAIMTNATEEGFEAIIRKGTGQSYTFNDTLVGMMSGAAFETGKLASGGYKVDVEAVRSFLNAEVKNYTLENGHVPDPNDLRAIIGEKTIPGSQITVNQLHTMMANSGIKEARLIEMKGGKEGRPGIDYGAEPSGDFKLPDTIKKGENVEIPIDRITYDPEHIEAAVKGAIDNGEPRVSGGDGTKAVDVTQVGDKILMYDGNRRLFEAMQRGDKTIKARFISDVTPGSNIGLSSSKLTPSVEARLKPAVTPPERFATPADGKVKQVFRTDKFNVDEAGQARLKAVQETLGLTARDVRSWKDVEAAAKDVGADPARLLRRVEGKTQLSDVEVEALRQNVASAHEFLANKYTLIDEASARGDKAAITEIENKVKISEKIIDSSVKKLIGGGTELGRGVAIYRKIAAMKMDDPTYFYKEAMKLLDDGRKKVRFGNQTAMVEDGSLPPALREAIDSLMKSNDQVGLSYLMAQLRKSNNWDKAVHLWKAGLLTAPTTDLANILGNTTMMALETVKDVPATIADILISGGQKASNNLFGTKLDDARVKTVTARMQMEQAKGLYEGAGKAKDFLLTGIDPDDILGKYDVRGTVNYNSAVLQGYTNAIFRKLGAEDLVFRYGFINKSLMESAELRVKNMSRAELSDAINGLPEGVPRTRAQVVKQMFLNPSDEATVRAINAAEYGTFQRDNPVSAAISGAKRGTTPGGRALLEFIAPFTRTPTNIGFTIFDYTPVGFITELAKQLKSPNKLRLVESFGRGVVGTSVMALGSALNKEGLMTGNAPSSEAERKLWEADRKQPNSIFIGGKWRKLDRISPLGNLLTIGAEFNELGKTKTRSQQWTQIGFEGIKSVTEQSFLLGVSNALKALTEPDRFAETFAENAIRGIVPNIIARVAAGTDKYARDSGSLNPIAVLQERIPILRELLPEKLDVLGRKIRQQGGFFGTLFDPFSSKKPSSDPVIQELTRLGKPISAPNRALYSDEEYRSLVDLRGRILMTVLGEAMDDSGYKALPDEGKMQIIDLVDSTITREVHDQVRMASAQRMYEELQEMSPSDRTKKMEQIKKKNSTTYTLILLLQSANDNDQN